MAVLVLALYINSETAHALYRHPELIWLLCPLLLYLLSRVWLLARRGQLHETRSYSYCPIGAATGSRRWAPCSCGWRWT